MNAQDPPFIDCSIIVPVMNETFALEQTVQTVLGSCRREDLAEILLIVCDRTRPQSMGICRRLQAEDPSLYRVVQQTFPFLGGAMRDAFGTVRGSHALMMSSDLETDPNDAKVFLEKAKANPGAIITASRWIKGGGFRGYNPLKLVANWIFQHFFCLLYGCKLTDMTFGYRLFPVWVLQRIRWEELRHPLMLETIVKPLRLGVPVIEIPTKWVSRPEGDSQNTFMRNFAYFRIGLKTRFRDPREFTIDSEPGPPGPPHRMKG